MQTLEHKSTPSRKSDAVKSAHPNLAGAEPGQARNAVLQLQRSIGNRAVSQILRAKRAEQVTLPTGAGQPAFVGVQRQAGDVPIGELLVQRAPFAKRQQAMQPAGDQCPVRFSRTRSFAAYINLVREAETRLADAGFSTAEDRVHVLRGIYYGADWSADYLAERSPVRNLGFQVYTASTTPGDPRQYLTCGLFEALRGSQDLVDGGRRVDAGHLMIGLDARRSWTARNIPIPTQGGTGLEIATWLGDLGGGAGMLAYRRADDPKRSVMTVFSGTDFGGSINLEGDIAAYVVARDGAAHGSAEAGATPLSIPAGGTVADALQAYLLPPSGTRSRRGTGGGSTEWNNRCTTFLEMIGGTIDKAGNLNNTAMLVSALTAKIQDFAYWYLFNRLRQSNRLTLATLSAASAHVPTCAREVAQVFVAALDACHSGRSQQLTAQGK
jgi:hypothetical protein